MNEEIEFGLTLMAVGMTTVLSILALVVLGGKTLIFLVNKFSPEIEMIPVHAHAFISKTKISVLASAVSAATKGKGTITNIKKI